MGGTGRRTHRRVDAASSTTTRTGQRSAHEHERGSAETSRFQIRRSHHDPISSRDRQLIKDRRRACHGHRFSCPLTNSAPPQDTNTKAWPCALARGGLRLSGRSRRGGARAGKRHIRPWWTWLCPGARFSSAFTDSRSARSESIAGAAARDTYPRAKGNLGLRPKPRPSSEMAKIVQMCGRWVLVISSPVTTRDTRPATPGQAAG